MRASVTVDGKAAYTGPKAHAEGFARVERRKMREAGEKVNGRVKVKVAPMTPCAKCGLPGRYTLPTTDGDTVTLCTSHRGLAPKFGAS